MYKKNFVKDIIDEPLSNIKRDLYYNKLEVKI